MRLDAKNDCRLRRRLEQNRKKTMSAWERQAEKSVNERAREMGGGGGWFKTTLNSFIASL